MSKTALFDAIAQLHILILPHKGTLQLFKSFASDSHDDFKPQYKEQAATSSAIDTIETDLKSHKVFVYMKVVLW